MSKIQKRSLQHIEIPDLAEALDFRASNRTVAGVDVVGIRKSPILTFDRQRRVVVRDSKFQPEIVSNPEPVAELQIVPDQPGKHDHQGYQARSAGLQERTSGEPVIQKKAE